MRVRPADFYAGNVDREEDEQHVDKSFESPQEAALAGWRSTPATRARAVVVEPAPGTPDSVWVTIEFDEDSGMHHREIVTATRSTDGRWREGSSFGA